MDRIYSEHYEKAKKYKQFRQSHRKLNQLLSEAGEIHKAGQNTKKLNYTIKSKKNSNLQDYNNKSKPYKHNAKRKFQKYTVQRSQHKYPSSYAGSASRSQLSNLPSRYSTAKGSKHPIKASSEFTYEHSCEIVDSGKSNKQSSQKVRAKQKTNCCLSCNTAFTEQDQKGSGNSLHQLYERIKNILEQKSRQEKGWINQKALYLKKITKLQKDIGCLRARNSNNRLILS